MSYSTETSWHCVLCGSPLNKWEPAQDGPVDMECSGKSCSAVFTAHSPDDDTKKHGDSFSLTYIH